MRALTLLMACSCAWAGPCDTLALKARAANDELRGEVFARHPKHPLGAMALAELKRSDELLTIACTAKDRDAVLLEAAMATRNARERLAGRMPASL